MSWNTLDLLLFLELVVRSRAQLQIEIRQYDYDWTTDNFGLDNFTILAEYTFPSGLTSDWFKTYHLNIPPEGILGVLHYPYPTNGCSSLNMSDCELEPNVSRMVILDDYHLCTQQKIYSTQEASFDALITYDPDGGVPDLEDKVYDESIGEDVRIETDGTPLLVVTRDFAEVLLRMAVVEDCFTGDITLVNISARANSWFFTFIGMCVFITGAFLVILGCAAILLCRCRCRGRRGMYNVHEIQIELGGIGESRVQYLGAQTLPYSPKEQEFHYGEAGGNTQCSICLEDFEEGEATSVLECDGKHTFHPACIKTWLESQSVCPVCRTFMTPTYVT